MTDGDAGGNFHYIQGRAARGKPYAGSHCNECGRHATKHFSLDHPFESGECSRDAAGEHTWSQAGDGCGERCKYCKKRNPKFYPQDWPIGEHHCADCKLPLNDDEEWWRDDKRDVDLCAECYLCRCL